MWLFAAMLAVLGVRADADGPRQPAAASRPAGTEQPVPETSRGSLVICGGGGLPGPVRQEFIRLAGGPQARIVVIPTASAARRPAPP
jgi:cyanophycinase